MMYARRSPFRTFLMVGLGILLGAAIFGGAETAGALVAAPLVVLGFLFKMVLFFLLFGFIARAFTGFAGKSEWGRDRARWAEEARDWRRRHGQSDDTDRPSTSEESFEEWHRMAHARREVDEHTPPVED